MAFTPKKFGEWHFNEILYALLTIKEKKEYMLIFQEHDLENYLIKNVKKLNGCCEDRVEASSAIGNITKIDNFCQTFRADAVMLKYDGTPYIIETKMKQAATPEACNDLVLQTLIYANIVLSPAYYNKDNGKPIPPFLNTRKFLDLLAKAHWFSRFYDSKVGKQKLSTVEHKAMFMFSKKRFSIKSNTCNIIFAIANPKSDLLPILLDACQRVKTYNFDEYQKKASFNKNARFIKRIMELKYTWHTVQSVSFHFIPINIDTLKQTIGEPLDLLN